MLLQRVSRACVDAAVWSAPVSWSDRPATGEWTMTGDVYAPPAARVEDVEEMPAHKRAFYVAALRKFIRLYVLTFQ
ncbi:MAG TPA: hypothetical protein VLF18_22390 [Tahibacter sp.]|uniref:hypothetical protein n=1 Tax=Tahibacter sp. TaxID=2056211 RepID=UPI002BFCEEDE|nr:hypothetical protein [Tahibacter sp.]HSX62944.1 hypothetical protein [Tahibacter sp.]